MPVTIESPTTRPPSFNRYWRETLDLLASMRFSISLLTLICIASVIGTVVKQNEPPINYVNQFGPLWAEIFGALGLYTVYSAWWFLLILAFLVVSTSLCIARNTPKILQDLRNYKEGIREQALQAFHLKGDAVVHEHVEDAKVRVQELLRLNGWKHKFQPRPNGLMLAARKGASNKLGYVAAHSAVVLICVGGLMDGDLIIKTQMWLQGKTAFRETGLVSSVPDSHRLPSSGIAFRANLLVPEGGRSGTALIHTQEGVVLQDLPFEVELKKFVVEYYSTGMPKLFASEILIHDKLTAQTTSATVEVNKPVFHRGVAIYQSSFDDGGSTVKLRGIPMTKAVMPSEVSGQVGSGIALTTGRGPTSTAEEQLTLELTGLRTINVEDFSDASSIDTVGSAAKTFDFGAGVRTLEEHLGSGVKVRRKKDLRNIGPSVSYKLRDAAGQAREFNNYMFPIDLDGHSVFLAGVRETPNESFKYIRIPADDRGSLDGFVRLKAALADPVQRQQAIDRYVSLAAQDDRPDTVRQLRDSANRTLEIFSGEQLDPNGGNTVAGLPGLSLFLERSVPEAERERISEVLLRILNGCLYELLNISRSRVDLPPLPADENTRAFLTQSVISLSDSHYYPAPLLFAMTDFKQVQASVFQVTRAPGKYLVYLGAVALMIGVFMMLYVRERRLWVWIGPAESGKSKITIALSATRSTLEADAEFEAMRTQIFKLDMQKPTI